MHKMLKKILENSLVIAHECNVKYCKYILCPICHKELISNIVTEKKDEMINTPTAKKWKDHQDVVEKLLTTLNNSCIV